VYACVVAGKTGGVAETPTCSGNGQTWALVDDVENGDVAVGDSVHIFVFHAKISSPSAGAITFDFDAETEESFAWHIVQCTNTADSATVQSTTAQEAASVSGVITGTLAALEHSTNVHLAFACGRGNAGSWTPDADFLELSDESVGSLNFPSCAQWSDGETDCTTTCSLDFGLGIVSIEVKSA
jgi:hypothetical protein